eukprot:4239802-Pyramimonas_sp.AAC.1
MDGHGGLPPGPSEDQGCLLLQLQPAHALGDGAEKVVLPCEHHLAGVAANQGAHRAVCPPSALTAEMPVAQYAVKRSRQP